MVNYLSIPKKKTSFLFGYAFGLHFAESEVRRHLSIPKKKTSFLFCSAFGLH